MHLGTYILRASYKNKQHVYRYVNFFYLICRMQILYLYLDITSSRRLSKCSRKAKKKLQLRLKKINRLISILFMCVLHLLFNYYLITISVALFANQIPIAFIKMSSSNVSRQNNLCLTFISFKTSDIRSSKSTIIIKAGCYIWDTSHLLKTAAILQSTVSNSHNLLMTIVFN